MLPRLERRQYGIMGQKHINKDILAGVPLYFSSWGPLRPFCFSVFLCGQAGGALEVDPTQPRELNTFPLFKAISRDSLKGTFSHGVCPRKMFQSLIAAAVKPEMDMMLWAALGWVHSAMMLDRP